MRRKRLTAAVAVVAATVGAAAVPAAGNPAARSAGAAAAQTGLLPGDRTAAYGPYGFTTHGLGKTDSYGEPSIAIAPDGIHTVISTPGGGGVQIWHSNDDGASFAHTSTTSPNGGGDSEIDFLPDGTLLSADLEISDSDIKVSHDFGQTWNAGTRAGTEMDRQWLAHSPDGKTQWLVYHDFAAEAELISTSTDGGLTWTTLPVQQKVVNSPSQAFALPGGLVAPAPGSTAPLADQDANTFSGPLLIDPDGKDQYVVYSISDLQSNLNPQDGVPPTGPVRGIVVAHSGDAGQTWTNKYAVVAQPNVTDAADEEQTGSLFPWGFVDPAGTVYVIFNSNRGNLGTDKFHTYYVFSKDKGAHWSKAIKLDDLPIDGPGSALYNTGAAVKPGVVDFAWYQSDTTTPSQSTGTYVPHFAQVTAADTDSPKVVTQALTTVPNHHGGICLQGILCGIGPGSADRSLLDFFELAVNPKTGLAEVAYADNSRLTPTGASGVTGEVVFAKQTVAVPKVGKRPTKALGTTQAKHPASSPPKVTRPGGSLAATGGLPLAALALIATVLGLTTLRRRKQHRST